MASIVAAEIISEIIAAATADAVIDMGAVTVAEWAAEAGIAEASGVSAMANLDMIVGATAVAAPLAIAAGAAASSESSSFEGIDRSPGPGTDGLSPARKKFRPYDPKRTPEWNRLRGNAAPGRSAAGGSAGGSLHKSLPFPKMVDVDQNATSTHMETEIGIQSREHRKNRLHKISYRGGKNAGLSNEVYRNRPVFGDGLLQQQQNRCTPLVMKIGKHEKGKVGESIEKMLHNMSGSASVQSQWGGIITAGLGERKSFMTVIRHNLSYDENNAISYNTTSTDGFPSDNILMPEAVDIDIGGSTTLTSAFHVHGDQSVWYCPITRPDLEDMSWNLNKFKLTATIKNVTAYDGATATGQIDGQVQQDRSINMQDASSLYINWSEVGTFNNDGRLASFLALLPPSLCSNVAPNRPSYHRRQSELRLNNQRGPGSWQWVSTFPVLPITTPAVPQRYTMYRGDTYKYNMVFKSGSLLYNFMNKDPNAAEVTAIVYKVKKTALLGGLDSDFSGSQLFSRLIKPIGLGYVSSIMDKMGTEDLGGRLPTEADVVTVPNFPFLPKLKKTKQQNLPFTEVMRNTFVMPSGSRRNLKIDLPGEVYDPNNIPLANKDNDGYSTVYPAYQASGSQAANGTENVGPYYSDDFEYTPAPTYVSIVDEYTYCVVLAVNGVKSSRLFYDPVSGDNLANTEYLLGDTYSAANIQYNCEYTENIQACEYKSKGRSRLFNNALAVFPSIDGGTMVETTTCILPVGQAVRNPVSTVLTYDSSGVATAARTNTGANVGNE